MSIASGEQPASTAPAPADDPKPRPARPRLRRVPALDGLRGLAVAAVLLFHGGYLTGGWLGVDLFFVLSGFLITSLLLAEHRASGSIALVAFWGRRARRLLPALVAVLLAIAVYASQELGPADKAVARGDGLATLFFVSNWHDILGGVSYWDRGLAPSLLAHTWSLAVEEQMYLVWPVLVLLVLRGRTTGRAQRVLGLAAVVAALSAVLAIGLPLVGASNTRVYLGTDTRLVAVALGAVVAAWRAIGKGPTEQIARRVEVTAIVAGFGLLLCWWRLDGTATSTYRGGLLLASILAAVVVAGAADRRSTRIARVLSLAPLRVLGLISYGAYLWHWPVYVVLSPARTGQDGVVLLVLRIALTLVIAFGSYHLVELPIRERRPPGWWEGWRGFASALVAVAVVAGALAAGTSGAAKADASGLGDGVRRSSVAVQDLPPVLVVGDSVAASVAAPAIADPARYRLGVVRSTVNGCQVVDDGEHRVRGIEGDVSTPPPCPSDIRGLVAKENPAAVLVQYGGWVDAQVEVDGAWRSACDPQYRDLFERRLARVLDDAGSRGARVVVATAAHSTNSYREKDNDRHIDCVNALTKGVVARTKGATILDVDAWLCPGGTCRDSVDGLLIRSDGVHFNGPGGAKSVEWIFDEVSRIGRLHRPPPVSGTRGADRASSAGKALVRVCKSYLVLKAFGDAGQSGALSDRDAAAQLGAALDGFAPRIVDQLPKDRAADLRGLGSAQVRTDLLAVLAGIEAGDLGAASRLTPKTKAALDRGLARLRADC